MYSQRQFRVDPVDAKPLDLMAAFLNKFRPLLSSCYSHVYVGLLRSVDLAVCATFLESVNEQRAFSSSFGHSSQPAIHEARHVSRTIRAF